MVSPQITVSRRDEEFQPIQTRARACKDNLLRAPSYSARPVVHFEAASRAIAPKPGVVVIEVDPDAVQRGGFILSDREAAQTTPTMGTVLASGDPFYKPGDWVMFFPMFGATIFSAFWQGEYRSKGTVRVIGPTSFNIAGSDSKTIMVQPSRVMPIVVTPGQRPRMALDWVLIEQDPVNEQTDSGLYIAKGHSRKASFKGRVVAVGPDATDVELGDYVLFMVPDAVTGMAFIVDEFGDLTKDVGVSDPDRLVAVRRASVLATLTQ